jgi:hypothetical protein
VRRRRERLTRRADAHLTRGAADFSIAIAVDAKLFGRLRLLTLDALVEVGPTDGATGDLPPAPETDARAHRVDVETLLAEAREVLGPVDGRESLSPLRPR